MTQNLQGTGVNNHSGGEAIIIVDHGSDSKKICLQYGQPRFNTWVGKSSYRRQWLLQYPCLENSIDRGTWQSMRSQRVGTLSLFSYVLYNIKVHINMYAPKLTVQ